MARTYTLKRRAVQQAETRQRIAEAALELHATAGPVRTSLSMVAEKAGVQRHTLYAHFPDERSLFLACSGLVHDRDPLPDAAPWREIVEPRQRLQTGLSAIYGWYQRNAGLLGNILRDAEIHPLTREIVELRSGAAMADYAQTLGAGLGAKQRPMLALALSFFTWRTLTQEGGLETSAAVTAMAQAIEGAR
jgi:AcrR family transcriptional regulator